MTKHRCQQPTVQELNQIDLFSGLTREQLILLRRSVSRVSIEKNETLFSMGEAAKSFYYLQSGQMKVIRHDPTGKEKVLAIVAPDHMFAEAAFFLPERVYPASAVALQNSALLMFDSQAFLAFLEESPEFAFRMIANLSLKLKRFVVQIDNLSMQNAEMRVVSFIHNKLLESEESMASLSIKLDVSKQVLASQLAMTPETFSRTLRHLQDRKIICINGKLIKVKDLALLNNLYEDHGTL